MTALGWVLIAAWVYVAALAWAARSDTNRPAGRHRIAMAATPPPPAGPRPADPDPREYLDAPTVPTRRGGAR